MTSRTLVLLMLAGCGGAATVADSPLPQAPEVRGFTPEQVRAFLKLSPVPPPPVDSTNRVQEDPRAARLGQFIFFDERFSGSGEVSCATCHDPKLQWTDGRRLARAEGELDRHTMSLWNVAFNRWFFWDGRVDSLWAQALQPLENPLEHDFSRLQVAHLIYADLDLRRAYEAVFGPLAPLDDPQRFPAAGRPVDDDPDHPHAVAWASMAEEDRRVIDTLYANVGKSIAAFEALIVAGRASFDLFVEGVREGDALQQLSINESARNGLRLFLGRARCVLCHSGPLFSDLEFHDNRVAPLRGGKRLDAGRYEGVELVKVDPFRGTGEFSDDPDGGAEDKLDYLLRAGHNWSEFKTPSLRNAILTAPYMHQGQLDTLEKVLDHYNTLEDAVASHHQAERTLIPLNLTDEELADLLEFLVTLTDIRLDPQLMTQPETPSLP